MASKCGEFKRNRYFYGKLLTVRDFEREQEYFNSKRHLMNRLMYGSGVVCGLKVSTTVNNQGVPTIDISPGVAIDALGREIVVSGGITRAIANIDPVKGSSFSTEIPRYYLCLQYWDDGLDTSVQACSTQQPSCCQTSCTFCEEFCEYNLISEGWKLLLEPVTDDAVLPVNDERSQILYREDIIYEDNVIIVTKNYPQWVNPGEVFSVILKMERKSQSGNSAVEIKELCADFDAGDNGGPPDTIVVTEAGFENSEEPRQLTYTLAAPDLPAGMFSSKQVVSSSIKSITSGGIKNQQEDQVITVTADSVRAVAVREQMNQKGDCADCAAGDKVRIARLTVNFSGQNPVGIVAEPVQVVYNNRLLYEAIKLVEKRGQAVSPEAESNLTATGTIVLDQAAIQTGVLEYQSQAIVPFGTTPVSYQLLPYAVQAALEHSSGIIGVNENNEDSPALVAEINKNKGTFIIKLKFSQAPAQPVKVRWWAAACSMQQPETRFEAPSSAPLGHLQIVPDQMAVSPEEKFSIAVKYKGIEVDRERLTLTLYFSSETKRERVRPVAAWNRGKPTGVDMSLPKTCSPGEYRLVASIVDGGHTITDYAVVVLKKARILSTSPSGSMIVYPGKPYPVHVLLDQEDITLNAAAYSWEVLKNNVKVDLHAYGLDDVTTLDKFHVTDAFAKYPGTYTLAVKHTDRAFGILSCGITLNVKKKTDGIVVWEGKELAAAHVDKSDTNTLKDRNIVCHDIYENEVDIDSCQLVDEQGNVVAMVNEGLSGSTVSQLVGQVAEGNYTLQASKDGAVVGSMPVVVADSKAGTIRTRESVANVLGIANIRGRIISG